jgi:hypothetical protein
MASRLGWLDHDPEERERATRILALFREKDARDELGLGGIRESIADQLFPGTSTIQTRLRYMLFVPWIYRYLEDERCSSSAVAQRARKLEVALIAPLLDEQEQGVFGVRARGDLKRLPSSVYWAGLGSWGIRGFAGSLDQYHAAFDRLHSLRSPAASLDDDDPRASARATWDPALPAPPERFPDGISLQLTREEAEYLRDRICVRHPGSLLAWLTHDPEPALDDPYIWMHPRRGSFPLEQRELVHHAHLFAQVMSGAALLYNLELARVHGREELVHEHSETLAQWAGALAGKATQTLLHDWTLARFWYLVCDHGHTITHGVRAFVETWVQLARSGSLDLIDGNAARALVRARERSLKGVRSRFDNARARDQWGGYAGLGLSEYRWPVTRRFLSDLAAGLAAED